MLMHCPFLFGIFWCILRERNARIFGSDTCFPSFVSEKVMFLASLWALALGSFRSLLVMNLAWGTGEHT